MPNGKSYLLTSTKLFTLWVYVFIYKTIKRLVAGHHLMDTYLTMAIHFSKDWYETIVAATTELTKTLDTTILDQEYTVLLEQLLDSNEENKDYFKATGKYAITLSKTLATREHLTIYKEEVKRELYSLVINARSIVENELNPKIKLTLDRFFKEHNLSYTDDDLTQLLFSVLVTLSTHLLDKNDLKDLETKKDNYISITKSIAHNIIESLKLSNILKKSNTGVRKEEEIAYLKLVKNQDYIHSQKKTITLEEEMDLIELGSTLLEIFLNINLIKSKVCFGKQKKNNHPQKKIIISLTEAGKRLLSKKKKIDYQFYKRLPLLHPAYPLTTNLQGNQYIMDISNLNDKQTNFVSRRHGVTIDFNRSDLSIIQNSVNYLTSTPYSINFWLFCQYQTTYIHSFLTLNKEQKTMLKSVSKGCRFYLPNPVQKKTHKARCNYVFQKINYAYYLAAMLCKNLCKIDTDNNVIKNLKHELKNAFKEKDFANDLNSYKQANKIRFYIPRFLDWRTRIYEVLVYLFSGSPFERSLITASTKQPLKDSFDIIANVAVTYYGKYPKNSSIDTTKLSWNDKVKLFRDNMAYYRNNKRYKFAKKPFPFTALIEELNEVGFWDYFFQSKNKESSREPESNLLVCFDNAASGMQLLTLVTGSENNNLNLCAQNADSPIEDAYGNVAKIVREILLQQSMLKIILDEKTLNFILKNQDLCGKIAHYINRAILKQIMMPYFYGITKRTISNKIRTWLKGLRKKLPILNEFFEARDLYFKYKNEKDSWEKINSGKFKSKIMSESEFEYYKTKSDILIALINTISIVSLKIISTIYPKIDLFFRTLRTFAVTVSYFQHPITWRPVGSNIILEQTYKKYVISQFTLPKRRKRGRIKRVTLKGLSTENFNSYNTKKAENGFPANFIQSFDASVLHSIVSRQRKLNYLTTTLHDNYALTPCYYTAFYSMYVQNLCEIFNEKNIQNLFDSFPNPENVLNNYLRLYKVDKLLDLHHGKKALQKYDKLLNSYNQLNLCLLGSEARNGREELFKGILNSRHVLTP